MAEVGVLKKGDRVVARHDLAKGVQAGDEGRIMLVNGVDWIRYWVDFGEGVHVPWLDADDIEPARKRGLFRR